jgi:tetratricopeptide (TPR) repeat protein
MMARRPRRLLRAALAASLCLPAAALAPCARAQSSDSTVIEQHIRALDSHDFRIQQMAPGMIIVGGPDRSEPPPAHQRPARPLTSDQISALRRAQALRLNGQFEQAREALAPLLAGSPHHPAVVTELARLLVARQDFAGVERLGRDERAAQKDSLLVARELTLALERLGRPRDAAGVALECWLASPLAADWAEGTIARLAPADAPGVRELLRRAAEARPARTDLLRATAVLDWRAGDLKAALETLERADRPAAGRAPLRWDFAQELLSSAASRDSGAAAEALVALAGDDRFDTQWRLTAAQHAWELQGARGAEDEAAPTLVRALRGVPAARWPAGFLVALARGLRQAGHTDDARALVRSGGAPRGAVPQLDLEEALADLRDGPPERALPRLAALAAASPEGTWEYAEALFFTGATDSALVLYQRIGADPQGRFSGAALERVYLIEDADPRAALAVFGRIAYEQWRGERRRALALTDSLTQALPHGALWAQAALLLAAQRDAAGDVRGALAPLLAVADSLPEDRLAPLARQRAGDLYLSKLKDEHAALAQYEECLARYPRAWNAPEVRRVAERLRRGHPAF